MFVVNYFCVRQKIHIEINYQCLISNYIKNCCQHKIYSRQDDIDISVIVK